MTDKIKDISAVMPQADYDALVGKIDSLWSMAKIRAAEAVNTELLDANWQTDNILWSLSRRVRFVPSMANF